MATAAIRMFRKLEGLFCVYKPAGVHWKLVRDTIETNLLKGEFIFFLHSWTVAPFSNTHACFENEA